MINLNFDGDYPGGRTFDHDSKLMYPWYTKSFLNELIQWEISDWKVFEYGGGDSTLWWKKHVKNVITIDTNKEWANKLGVHFSDEKNTFISFPTKFISDELFDCIIIDSDPVSWRDDCTEYAIKCLKPNGILIVDNYEQQSINCTQWQKTNEILKDKEKNVFHQIGHIDWKTCFWKI